MKVIVIKTQYHGDRVACLVMNEDERLDAVLEPLRTACKQRELVLEEWAPDRMTIEETIEFIEDEYPLSYETIEDR